MRPVQSHSASPWRMMCGRGVALAAVLCTLLGASVVAADDDGDTGDPVIPPGEEQLIANMLGKGIGLQYCNLVSGGVEYSVIKATYNCLGNQVMVELGNPRNATATSIQTGQFAITVQSGSPTAGFQDALASLVRSQEGNFQWTLPQHEAATANDDAAE